MKTLVCIQHELTSAQVSELNGELVFLKTENPELFATMANSPADETSLHEIAVKLLNFVNSIGVDRVVFPLGSPALMWSVAEEQGYRKGLDVGYGAPMGAFRGRCLFAHTERRSSEVNGVKTSTFQHVKFLSM